MSDTINLTGLWKTKSKKDGSQFLSGKPAKDAKFKFMVFPVKNKKSPNYPDYNLVIAPVGQDDEPDKEPEEPF